MKKNIFSVTTDKVEEKGFISKSKILEYVTEQDIFQLVFGEIPEEFEYITSPLREDSEPGCWFETDITNGKLSFRDFSYGRMPLDCFDVVQAYYGISSFYKTLEFIKAKLIDGKNIKNDIVHIKPKARPKKLVKKKQVNILINTRPFSHRDRNYWSQYEISKQNLIDDKVFPTNRFKLVNTRKGDFLFSPKDICYAYTEFEGGRKKLYRPHNREKKGKFVTNCLSNDIGGINSLIPSGKQLIITKSYKDFRVLKNLGLNVVWFQNEGMFPDKDILFSLVVRFDSVIVFFDNDDAGKKASDKLTNIINEEYPRKAKKHWLDVKNPDVIKDPADFVKEYNSQELRKYLTYYKLL